MSWAAHNPELYDDICKKGICWKLSAAFEEVWGGQPDNPETFDQVIEVLQQEAPKAYDALLTWAHDSVIEAEQDYWGGLVDQAKSRLENP